MNDLTMQEVSQQLDVTIRTLFLWIKEDKIKSYKIGRRRFFKQYDIDCLKPSDGEFRCSKCCKIKNILELIKSSKMCKDCRYAKYLRNKPAIVKRSKRWRKKNSIVIKEKAKVYRFLNKDRIKQYAQLNKDKFKANKRRLLYGISKEDYDKMLLRCGGKCMICKCETKLHVDHNHNTKQVRDLLCRACNYGIGNFKENISLLKEAIKYLKTWEKK